MAIFSFCGSCRESWPNSELYRMVCRPTAAFACLSATPQPDRIKAGINGPKLSSWTQNSASKPYKILPSRFTRCLTKTLVSNSSALTDTPSFHGASLSGTPGLASSLSGPAATPSSSMMPPTSCFISFAGSDDIGSATAEVQNRFLCLLDFMCVYDALKILRPTVW